MIDPLMDDAPCGFIVFTEKGIVTYINLTAAEFLDFTVEELLGEKFDVLMGIAGRIFFQTHFFPMLRLHGKATEIFLNLRSKSGREVPVLVNAKHRTLDGVPGFHCVLMPVPQRLKYESELVEAKKIAEAAIQKNEQLLQSQADLEVSKISLDQRVTQLSLLNDDLARFSKVISHDMQEPIRKIAMFTDILGRELKGEESEKFRHATARIASASARLRNLISCIDQYVNLDIQKSPIEACDLNIVIENARMRASASLGGAEIEISTNGLPVLEAKTDQLELLFYQLIMNAVQFRKPGTTQTHIHIEADIIQQNSFLALHGRYRYIDYVRIVFSDDGSGFRQEYNEYIFQLFKSAHDGHDGLGFGLALCRKIVSGHFGTITAHSEPSQGATFRIQLPLMAEQFV